MVSVSRTVDFDSNIREITDEEVAAYELNGWVKLDRLVSPELAENLRRMAVSLPPLERGRSR